MGQGDPVLWSQSGVGSGKGALGRVDVAWTKHRSIADYANTLTYAELLAQVVLVNTIGCALGAF